LPWSVEVVTFHDKFETCDLLSWLWRQSPMDELLHVFSAGKILAPCLCCMKCRQLPLVESGINNYIFTFIHCVMRYFSTQVTSYPLIFAVNNRQKLRNEWKQMYILKKRYRQKYVHKQAKMESQRNVACSKNKKTQ